MDCPLNFCSPPVLSVRAQAGWSSFFASSITATRLRCRPALRLSGRQRGIRRPGVSVPPRTRSLDTVTAATTARCHESRPSISATDTLKRSRNRSFKLLTTWRFSFKECDSSTWMSRVNIPITGTSYCGAGISTAIRSIMNASSVSPTWMLLKFYERDGRTPNHSSLR